MPRATPIALPHAEVLQHMTAMSELVAMRGAWLAMVRSAWEPEPLTFLQPATGHAAEPRRRVFLVTTLGGEELVLTERMLEDLNGPPVVEALSDRKVRVFTRVAEDGVVIELTLFDLDGEDPRDRDEYLGRMTHYRAEDDHTLLLLGHFPEGPGRPATWPR